MVEVEERGEDLPLISRGQLPIEYLGAHLLLVAVAVLLLHSLSSAFQRPTTRHQVHGAKELNSVEKQ